MNLEEKKIDGLKMLNSVLKELKEAESFVAESMQKMQELSTIEEAEIFSDWFNSKVEAFEFIDFK